VLNSLQKFDFVLAVCVLRELLLLCRSVSEFLQSDEMDMLASLAAISDLTNKLQGMRNDSETTFHSFYEAACTECCKPTILELQFPPQINHNLKDKDKHLVTCKNNL